jgi:hypothetical protein
MGKREGVDEDGRGSEELSAVPRVALLDFILSSQTQGKIERAA